MIKLQRPKLPDSKPKQGAPPKPLPVRQDKLNQEIAAAVDDASRRKAIEKHWGNFKTSSTGKAIRKELGAMCHEKCAYCEAVEANAIEHHWPKALYPGKTFDWNNLLLSCSTCNDPARKGESIEFIDDGTDRRTKLLDPTAAGDDPLKYLAVELDGGTAAFGWLEPGGRLSDDDRKRAAYTVKTLGLNLRDPLVRARRDKIEHFFGLLQNLRDGGPDLVLETKRKLRDVFVEFLSRKAPYLGAIRQVLRTDPSLRKTLVDKMPELESEICAWDLDPDPQ